MRASDSDRDRVAEALREAAAEGRLSMEELDERLDQVFAAKTYAELAPVTRDLPAAGASPANAVKPATSPQGINRYGGAPGGNLAIAIMGGFSRKGDWVAPAEMTAVAIMGGGEIDMRDARFAEHSFTITAIAIMGGMEITVPEDANVVVNGIGIMGGFNHAASGGGSPDGPRIVINGFAFWGGVEVRRRPPSKRAVERARRQGELDGA
jgi:hypothetical protein